MQQHRPDEGYLRIIRIPGGKPSGQRRNAEKGCHDAYAYLPSLPSGPRALNRAHRKNKPNHNCGRWQK
ncbi:MAG: hypothetical protein ACE5F7_09975 [Nitrospiria bacterium]